MQPDSGQGSSDLRLSVPGLVPGFGWKEEGEENQSLETEGESGPVGRPLRQQLGLHARGKGK